MGARNIELRDQKDEYIWRPTELEDFNYWDYFIETYDVRAQSTTNSSDLYNYSLGSPRHSKRKLRKEGHETLPQFIGRWFPSRNDKSTLDIYRASMLALFKPWRRLEDLKPAGQTFEHAFDVFMTTCSPEFQRIMDNMEYYHTSAKAAHRDPTNIEQGPMPNLTEVMEEESSSELIDHTMLTHERDITDEDLTEAKRSVYTPADERFATRAMFFAFNAGVFDDCRGDVSDWAYPARIASLSDMQTYEEWHNRICNYMRGDGSMDYARPSFNEHGLPGVEIDEHININDPPGLTVVEQLVNTAKNYLTLAASNTVFLNAEQQRAFSIVKKHIAAQINGQAPEQLLMIVDGCGGTGKSALIEAITTMMEQSKVSSWLAKTATSGVAATRIGGMTLHSWAAVGVTSKVGSVSQSSAVTLAKRIRHIAETRYLIIDEFSMLTKSFLEMISEVRDRHHCGERQILLDIGMLPN